MQRRRKYCFWLLLGLACCRSLSAQNAGVGNMVPLPEQDKDTTKSVTASDVRPFVVRNIIILGNKRTRPEINPSRNSFQTRQCILIAGLSQKFETARAN
jgi:hypothetical protein